MRKLFSMLLRDENITSALVLDDDVMFSCSFRNDLRKLLKEPRCGAHVSADSERGGVLLLGSSIWLNGTYPLRGPYLTGWNIVDEDMRRNGEQVARIVANGPTCFNVPSKVMGSFAVLFHRDVFQPIIDWIDSSSRPFDHVFEALADSGFVVRAAYPSIAVQDLTHESSVDPGRSGQQDVEMRARTHRWSLDKMCYPGSNAPVVVKSKSKAKAKPSGKHRRAAHQK
jgi:hypothetical protein